ncbi:MAG: hypothetical protein ACPGLY_10335 [Rubripirellula sp.]
MKYWPAKRWKIAIIEQGIEQWVEPELPYALIGSHPCCTIQIAEPRVSPFVYFACCFADSVESWPLCPIAFPRWGATLPEHALAVGKKRISLFHQSHSLWSDVVNRGEGPKRSPIQKQTELPEGRMQTPGREITLDWDGKQRPKALARRAMILGSEHPSTLRLYGQGLAPCDHAVICVGDSVWLINLNPDSSERDLAKLCKPLNAGPSYETVGNVKLRLGKIKKASRMHVSSSPALPEASASLSGIFAAGLSFHTSPQNAATPKSAQSPQKNRGKEPQKRGKHKRGKQKRRKQKRGKSTAASTGTNRSPDVSVPQKRPRETALKTPEALTSQLTDRLVKIDNARFTRRRILTITTIAAGFLVALAIILWIIFVLLIPKITEMMG